MFDISFLLYVVTLLQESPVFRNKNISLDENPFCLHLQQDLLVPFLR